MAADTDRPANVQAYLDKHRISSLFETLTSHLVKDLPADPLGFLILKLQGIKKKAPVSSSKPAASTGLRKPTATSSSATGARKPVSSASSVASSRSTTSRPPTSSSGIAKPSSAKTRPSSVKQSSTAAPDTKASSTRAPGGSRIPRSPVKPVKSGVAGKPSAPPTTAPPTGAARTRKPTSATTTRATTTSSSATKGKPDHDSKLTKPSSSSKPSSVPTNNKERVTKTTPSLPAPVAPPPPSVSSVSDDELSDDETQLVDYDSDDEQDQQYSDQEEEEFDINALVLKLKRSKGPNKRHRDHLSVASGLLQTSPSSGYQTSEDEPWEEEEEGGLDVAESATVLELEEGITLGHQTRIIAKKLPRPDPVINLNVMVCGRCGNIMNQQQDSASQVDGSHVTFPQWDDTTSTLTSKPCDISDQSSTSTSWHGVGQVPLVSCMEPSTDETSDLMVPDPVPAAQQPRHEEDQDQLEEEEMIGGEDQL